MELIGPMLTMMGRVFVSTFTTPLYIFLYGLLFLLVAWQYRRQQSFSEGLPGAHNHTYLKAAFLSAVYGILGGLFGSILLVLLGIDLSNIGITQLWLVALVLMLIQPRFLCFSYAAGVLAAGNLLFGYPHISIPQLMGLVAILHMVESSLILLNGPSNAGPIYIKKQGQLQGGFNLQLFWPIPLIALMSVGAADLVNSGLEMPSWWPLLKDYASFADDQTFTLLPVLAILGYGEISTTRTPTEASRKSSLLLFLFSLLLLLLSLLSSYYAIFLPLAALFSPLGHELVIWLGMRAETRPPIYVPPERGVMILQVLAGSSAARAGLKSRDIIRQANGQVIEQAQSLTKLFKQGGSKLELEIERNHQPRKVTLPLRKKQNPGLILVPDSSTNRYLAQADDRIFFLVRRIWWRLKFWLKK